MAKRYYWLKLKNDFFTQARMKKLRKLPKGEILLIVYLKMQLLSVSTNGKIIFQGLEDTFPEEIALTIDEEPEDVETAIEFLSKYGLVEELSSNEYSLSEVKDSIGSETASAERMRQKRAKEKESSEQCSNNVPQCDDIYNNNVAIYRDREEIELEIEKEKDKKHTPKENSKEKFIAPQVCVVKDYLNLKSVDYFTAEEFINYYASTGWKNKYGVAISDWKALLDSWIERKRPKQEQKEEPQEEPKSSRDFMSVELIDKLKKIGALEEDGALNFGIAQDHGLLDGVREADRKATEWNRRYGK